MAELIKKSAQADFVLMKNLHKKYPMYGFAKHKGYGTKQHQEAIKKYSLTRIHRKSFNLDRFLNV